MRPVTLRLIGPVTLTGAAGEDLTPRSMKARGVLAMLGVSTRHRASRAKLQDKLWSDRPPEQGSASLRQALAEIRRALGPHRDALQTGPGWVALDPGLVEVVLSPDQKAVGAVEVEFAEDLDIRDPEFEDWILQERQHFADVIQANGTKSAPLPTILPMSSTVLLLSPARSADPALEAFCTTLVRDAAKRAGDFIPVDIFTDGAVLQDFPGALRVVSYAFGGADSFTVHLAIERNDRGQQVWSRSFEVSSSLMAGQMRFASEDLTLAILQATNDYDPDTIGGERRTPVFEAFSFVKADLLRAERQLTQDSDNSGSSGHLALRAFMRNTMLLERMTDTPEETLAEAVDLSQRAISRAPHNAFALAVASYVANFQQQGDLALDLSLRATQADSCNPIAQDSLAKSLTMVGRHREALAAAARAREGTMSILSPATLLIGLFSAAVRAGEIADARRYAALAHSHNPYNRPALRFLAALSFAEGDEAGAAEALRKLRALEPDFTLDLMADESYPVRTLRASGLLGVTKSGLL